MLQEIHHAATDAITHDPGSVSVQSSRFKGDDGVEEIQWVIRPTRYAPFETQLKWVEQAYKQAVQSLGLKINSAVWRRFLCSDLANQVVHLENLAFSNPNNTSAPCAVSWVNQPPVPPSKVTLWAHHIHDPSAPLSKSKQDNSLSLRRSELTHHWTTGITNPDSDDAYEQSQNILAQYETELKTQNLSMADDVVRTWFFIKNIDTDYQDLVTARNELFSQIGLTPETHFIASTGIEGASHDVKTKVMMDAYAISGLHPEQVRHLSATGYLNNTHDYGVAFERATSISYKDRTHILISGTASIDSKGEILHRGDVSRQLERTLVNIDALLTDANASLKDMQVFIIYLRDASDQTVIMDKMKERFPETPFEIVTAPVCRPGWLIEIEGLAIVPNQSSTLPAF